MTAATSNIPLLNSSEIRTWRNLLNWSVKDLAAKANLSAALVTELESGHLSGRRCRYAFSAVSVAIHEERNRILSLADQIRKSWRLAG